jgi:hypothetical protein
VDAAVTRSALVDAATMRIALLVALAACSVKELDYTGKSCPCPSGYDCDLPSQTCRKLDSPIDARTDPDGGDAAVATDSCLPNARPSLMYGTGFNDFLSAWFPSAGAWSYTSGVELQQQNANQKLAYAFHMMTGSGDYRVVATMRVVDIATGSAGIGFRIGNGGNMYTCTFDPTTGDLSLILTQNLGDTTLQAKNVPFGDPRQLFTMEVQTVGAVHSCCVRDVAGGLITAMSGTLNNGNPGLVTREAAGGFTTFAVYQ